MKRLTVVFLIFLYFTFIVGGFNSAFAVTNTFTEGIHNVSDFNPSKNGIYIFSNVSSTETIYMIIIDENHIIHHSILLLPKSEKHITVPILPNYKIILLGKGEMYFYPQEPK